MRKLLFIIPVLMVFISCEKVIDIPLNEADQKVVVEAQLYDIPYESFVKLSKTGSVYDDGGFEKIIGASVIVSDNMGNTHVFEEQTGEPGLYLDTTFVALPNRLYTLTVVENGNTYSAISTVNSDVTLDSLDYILNVGGFGQDPNDTSYFTFYNFTDNGSEENYYRALTVVNGEIQTPYLNDDKLFNGNNFRQPFFGDAFGPGDTLTAYLTSMDKPAYTYFVTLESNQNSGGPFSATPANPVTNIEGGAIGFFGVFMTDALTIIFPE
ncbi:MAG: DUF4249 domain-containing protein [Crocinitomicaceae bacterium]